MMLKMVLFQQLRKYCYNDIENIFGTQTIL